MKNNRDELERAFLQRQLPYGLKDNRLKGKEFP